MRAQSDVMPSIDVTPSLISKYIGNSFSTPFVQSIVAGEGVFYNIIQPR